MICNKRHTPSFYEVWLRFIFVGFHTNFSPPSELYTWDSILREHPLWRRPDELWAVKRGDRGPGLWQVCSDQGGDREWTGVHTGQASQWREERSVQSRYTSQRWCKWCWGLSYWVTEYLVIKVMSQDINRTNSIGYLLYKTFTSEIFDFKKEYIQLRPNEILTWQHLWISS